jgi:4-amino-4-deoxy-L-arabinose transferase-like glycosyltransferase
VLIIAILLGAALRFHRIGDMPLRADEALTLFYATDLNTIFHQVTTDDPHLPTFYIMLHAWLPIAGSSELAARFPSLFAGVLVIPLTFVLGRTVFRRLPRVGLLAAFLVAWNPFLIWDAQDTYMYTFLTALSLASFILFLCTLRPDATWVTWVGYVVVSLLNLFIHYFAAFILMAQAVCLLVLALRKNVTPRKILEGFLAGVAIVILYTPWLILAVPVLIGYQSDFLVRADLLEMASRTLMGLTVGRADNRLAPSMIEPKTAIVLALVFLILFLYGLLAASKNSSDPLDARLGLLTYLFVPLIVIFGYSLLRVPIFDERFVLYLAPAFLLIVAQGLNVIYELHKSRVIAFAGLLYILGASAYSLFNYWYVPQYAKSPDWRGFVDYIAAEAQSGDALIQNYPDPALPYYLKDRIPRILLPRSSAQNEADLNADLTRVSARFNRLWFQPAPHSTWDTDGQVATWLERHARELREYDVRGARLELYLPAATSLRDAKPISAKFDNRIQLLAFDLDQTKPIALRLYWRTNMKLERDYTVFVHLYSSDGRLVAQKDSMPVNGTFPTTQWEANDTIVDLYWIAIPGDLPNGTYTLMIGMYDSQTQVRLPVLDSEGNAFPENRVLLATINLVSRKPGSNENAQAQFHSAR